MASDSSKKSIRSSGYGAPSQSATKFNRVYSPSGHTRQGGPGQDGSGNRIRREGAVSGSMNANNPQFRGSGQNFLNRSGSKVSVGNKSRVSSGIRANAGHLSDRSRSDKSDNSAKRIEPRTNLISVAKNSKFVLNTRTIDRGPEREERQRQREALRENIGSQAATSSDANIEDKISKLQGLLAMAKGGK